MLFVKTGHPYLRMQYSMERKGHASDSGMDLICAKSFTVRCGQTVHIDLGNSCEMWKGPA